MPSRVRMTALEVELGMALEDLMRYIDDWDSIGGRSITELVARGPRVDAQAREALAHFHTIVTRDEEDREMLCEKIKGEWNG